MEEKSAINCIEFPLVHEMESESLHSDALQIKTKDDLIKDSSEKSAFINKVHNQLVQQSALAKQAKMQCKCKVCGVQSTNFNWFAKHVAEHQQENFPSLKESVSKLKKNEINRKKIEEKSVLKIRPKILQSSSIVNEPKSTVNEHEFKEPLLNESNEDVNNPVKIELSEPDKVSDPQDRKKRLFQYIIRDNETGLEACSFCQKVYQGPQRNLMDHIDRVHLKVRSYECQFCDKKYASKSQLCTHLKLKHLNVQSKEKKLQVPKIKLFPSIKNIKEEPLFDNENERSSPLQRVRKK